jgi:hypothetical protein
MVQQAIHWARLAAKNDPDTLTILVIPDINWYQNYSPHTGLFPDTHTIAHFAADTIIYDEPINPQVPIKPRIEPLAIHIFCTHHQNYNIGTTNQLETIKTIIESLQITQYHIQTAPPTPHNTIVNKNPKWNKLLYPPHTNRPTTQIPPIPTYDIITTLKFSPQYSYYTTDRLSHQNKLRIGDGRKKKPAMEFITQRKQKYKYPKDYPDYKHTSEPN